MFGDMLQPESSIRFIYCLSTYIPVMTGAVVDVKNGLHQCYLNNYIRYFFIYSFFYFNTGKFGHAQTPVSLPFIKLLQSVKPQSFDAQCQTTTTAEENLST